MNKLVLGTAVAVVGLVAAGLGLAGVASAAPVEPSPASTAPAPVPLVYQPVDASDGFYGMRRGSVPPASTADLSPVPIVNQLPVIGVTPLPDNSDEATEESATDESDTAETDQ